MNLLNASIRLGKELKKNSIGQDLLTKYTNAKNSICSESWSIFLKTSNRFMYVDGVNPFKLALEHLSIVNKNKNLFYDEIAELLKSHEIHEFSNAMDIFFKDSFQFILNIMANLSDKNYPDIDNKINIQRKVVDLQSTYLNTQISNHIHLLANNNSEKMNAISEISDLIGNSDFYLNSFDNFKKFIKKTRNVYNESDIIMSTQISIVPKIINRGIYSGIFELIYKIPNENIERYKEKKFNDYLSVFHIVLKEAITPIIFDHENIYIYEVYINETRKYLHCIRLKRSFSEGNRTYISGFIYPENEKCIYSNK